MSSPLLHRTVARMPCSSSTVWKSRIRASGGRAKLEPSQSLNGIRLILPRMPLSSLTRRRASSTESLTSVEQHVLEGHALAERQREAAAGREQFLDREAAVDRHDPVADLVAGGVERDGQVDPEVLLGEPLDAGHQPHRGDRDAAGREREGLRVGEQAERLHGGRVVGERLTHAHVDDVGDPEARGQPLAGRHHLAHDLPGAQVALEPHRAGVAEGAAEAAADLGGDAEREPIGVGHQHRLDARAVAVAEHELLAAVLRRGAPLDLGHVHARLRGQGGAEVPGQVGHRVQVGHALDEDPLGKLAAPIARGARGSGPAPPSPRVTDAIRAGRSGLDGLRASVPARGQAGTVEVLDRSGRDVRRRGGHLGFRRPRGTRGCHR